MTRQSRARWLAFATAVLVVLLAALFTWLRNLTPAPRAATAPAPAALSAGLRVERGRQPDSFALRQAQSEAPIVTMPTMTNAAPRT